MTDGLYFPRAGSIAHILRDGDDPRFPESLPRPPAPAPDPLRTIVALLALVDQTLDQVVRVSVMAKPGEVLVVDTSALDDVADPRVVVHPDDVDRVRTAVRAALFGGAR